MELEEDTYLTIKLLSYNLPTPKTERFYFMEMSTLQATTLIEPDVKVTSIKIYSYSKEDEYVDDKITATFKTIKDFNEFFIENSQFYLHECDLEFENGMTLFSHDDGEVSITFSLASPDRNVIDEIFAKYHLERNLINELTSRPGHYLVIDKNSNITADYEDFEEYYEKGR